MYQLDNGYNSTLCIIKQSQSAVRPILCCDDQYPMNRTVNAVVIAFVAVTFVVGMTTAPVAAQDDGVDIEADDTEVETDDGDVDVESN